MLALPTFPRTATDTTVEQATAQITTADADTPAGVLIVDDQLRTIATIRLGEYSYQAEGVAAIRAAGWRVHDGTIVDLHDGYFAAPVFRG